MTRSTKEDSCVLKRGHLGSAVLTKDTVLTVLTPVPTSIREGLPPPRWIVSMIMYFGLRIVIIYCIAFHTLKIHISPSPRTQEYDGHHDRYSNETSKNPDSNLIRRSPPSYQKDALFQCWTHPVYRYASTTLYLSPSRWPGTCTWALVHIIPQNYIYRQVSWGSAPNLHITKQAHRFETRCNVAIDSRHPQRMPTMSTRSFVRRHGLWPHPSGQTFVPPVSMALFAWI